MGYMDSAQLARFQGFRDRVQVAMMSAARDVSAEASDNSERHRLRRALAINVLQRPDDYINAFAWAVVSNQAITFNSNDGDVQFTVNSMWDGIAGAPPAQP